MCRRGGCSWRRSNHGRRMADMAEDEGDEGDVGDMKGVVHEGVDIEEYTR